MVDTFDFGCLFCGGVKDFGAKKLTVSESTGKKAKQIQVKKVTVSF